jgi:hypothetical protein
MKMNLTLGSFLLLALPLLLTTSCRKQVRNETAQTNSLSTSSTISSPAKLETDLLKSVRNATSRFHSTTQAIKAGYVADEHCVSVPGLGGMGYHWVNESLVDPVFDPLNPEAVLYATGPGGKPRLIALEYIVIDAGQPAPVFGNQPFDVGGTPVPAPHWSLHVWLYEENPSGMFMPFNPNITCP